MFFIGRNLVGEIFSKVDSHFEGLYLMRKYLEEHLERDKKKTSSVISRTRVGTYGIKIFTCLHLYLLNCLPL